MYLIYSPSINLYEEGITDVVYFMGFQLNYALWTNANTVSTLLSFNTIQNTAEHIGH